MSPYPPFEHNDGAGYGPIPDRETREMGESSIDFRVKIVYTVGYNGGLSYDIQTLCMAIVLDILGSEVFPYSRPLWAKSQLPYHWPTSDAMVVMTIPLPHLFVAAVIGGFSLGVGSDCKIEPCAPSIIAPEATFIAPIPQGEFLTIDPRGVIWYKGKRADQLTDEELLEVVDLLMDMIRSKH